MTRDTPMEVPRLRLGESKERACAGSNDGPVKTKNARHTTNPPESTRDLSPRQEHPSFRSNRKIITTENEGKRYVLLLF